MAWGFDVPFVELAQQLVDTRLRIERVKLLQRLRTLEDRVALKGVETKSLKDLRKELSRVTPKAPDRIDRALVLPSKPSGVWRRKYLEVQSKPGSVF